MDYKFDVFISYASKDYLNKDGNIIPGNVITMIRSLFQKYGISYWINEKESLTGKYLNHVLAARIRESKTVVFICSKNAAESQWVETELSIAAARNKKIIPFVCDDSYLDDVFIAYTAKKGCIYYYEYPQSALQELLKSIIPVSPLQDKYDGYKKVHEGDYCGLTDPTGKVVVPCIYNDVTYFQEGLACVESDKRKWGFVDEQGNEVIPCKWEDVGFFSEGLAYVEDAFWKVGFIDKNGKVVIPCQWEDAMPFTNGHSFVKDTDGKWLKIDKKGQII